MGTGSWAGWPTQFSLPSTLHLGTAVHASLDYVELLSEEAEVWWSQELWGRLFRGSDPNCVLCRLRGKEHIPTVHLCTNGAVDVWSSVWNRLDIGIDRSCQG